jgi:hypothetical protein
MGEKSQNLYTASGFRLVFNNTEAISILRQSRNNLSASLFSTDNDVSDADADGNYATMINETNEILGQFLSTNTSCIAGHIPTFL